jgi:perosamine synthetase
MTLDSRWCWPPETYSPQTVINSYLNSRGSLTPKGRVGIIKSCEDAICERFSQKRSVLLNSGTSAIYAAFFAIDTRPGDEVICPTVTFHATATPALHWGAKVVLVDVQPDTACICTKALERAITPRTKAVITNAQWGHPVEQDRIRAICDKFGIYWIEDISHAHGATWNGRQVGSWGDLACMSLGAEKILTAGMAGVLMGRDDCLIDRAVLFTHYLFRSKHDIRVNGHEELARTGFGQKLGIHPLAAVIIEDQLLHHFDRWVAQRSETLMLLRDQLSKLEGLTVPTIRQSVTSMGGWYGFKPAIDFAKLKINRIELVRRLNEEGVEVDVSGSPPLHQLPLFCNPNFRIAGWEKSTVDVDSFPNADRYSESVLSLPTWTVPEHKSIVQDVVRGFEKVWLRLEAQA